MITDWHWIQTDTLIDMHSHSHSLSCDPPHWQRDILYSHLANWNKQRRNRYAAPGNFPKRLSLQRVRCKLRYVCKRSTAEGREKAEVRTIEKPKKKWERCVREAKTQKWWGKFWERTVVEKDDTLCKSGEYQRGQHSVNFFRKREGRWRYQSRVSHDSAAVS